MCIEALKLIGRACKHVPLSLRASPLLAEVHVLVEIITIKWTL